MKDKTIPIHNPCMDQPNPEKAEPPVDLMMMDHSKGDPKSMSKMKDPTVPIHHGGSADKPAEESAPK